jgi:phage terminase large subunit
LPALPTVWRVLENTALQVALKRLAEADILLVQGIPPDSEYRFKHGTLRIPTAPVFEPLLEPARYKGAHGGRGSGKSHFFGELMVEECLRVPGTLAVCIREVQKSLMQSSKRMIESKIQSLGVGSRFKILHDRIITPGDGLIIFQGMKEATAESIKSLEGFRIAWVEEAQTLTHRSLSLLRPTIRVKGSQLWANWNPRRKDARGQWDVAHAPLLAG